MSTAGPGSANPLGSVKRAQDQAEALTQQARYTEAEEGASSVLASTPKDGATAAAEHATAMTGSLVTTAAAGAYALPTDQLPPFPSRWPVGYEAPLCNDAALTR